MANNILETSGLTAGGSHGKTISQKSGWGLFGIGALYMFLMGWLSSWWVVPIIRQTGFDGIAGTAFFFFWQLSAPVGALLVAIGAAFIANIERPRKVVAVGGSLLVATWLFVSMGAIDRVNPPIFGIGGGLITLSFLGMTWDWAQARSGLSDIARTGADLGMAGHVFYLIAAWYLCGLLGAPTFLLRPELAMTILPENFAISMGTIILICMTFGSVLAFLSRRVILQENGDGTMT